MWEEGGKGGVMDDCGGRYVQEKGGDGWGRVRLLRKLWPLNGHTLLLGYRLPPESDGYDGDGQGGQFGASAASPP